MSLCGSIRSEFVGFLLIHTLERDESNIVSTISSSTFLMQLNSIINVDLYSIDQFTCSALDIADRIVHIPFHQSSDSSDEDVDVVYVSESHSAFTTIAVYVLLGTIGGIIGTTLCAYVIYKWTPSNSKSDIQPIHRISDTDSSAVKRLKSNMSVSKTSTHVQKHESLDSSQLRRNIIEINHYSSSNMIEISSDADHHIGEATLLNTKFPLNEHQEAAPIYIHRRAQTVQNLIREQFEPGTHRRAVTSPISPRGDDRESRNRRDVKSVHLPFRKRIIDHSITAEDVLEEDPGSSNSGSTDTMSFEETNPLKLKALTERKKSGISGISGKQRNGINSNYSPIPEMMGDDDDDGDNGNGLVASSYPDTVAFRGGSSSEEEEESKQSPVRRPPHSETFGPVGGHSNFHIGLRTDAVVGREPRAKTLTKENILLNELDEDEEISPRGPIREKMNVNGHANRSGSIDTHQGSFSSSSTLNPMHIALAHPSHSKYHSFGGHNRIKHFESMDSDSLSTERGDLMDTNPHSAPHRFDYLATMDTTPEIPEDGPFIKDTLGRPSFEPSTSSLDVMFNGDTKDPPLNHAYSSTMPAFSNSPTPNMIRRDVISQSMADIHGHDITAKVVKSVSKSVEKMDDDLDDFDFMAARMSKGATTASTQRSSSGTGSRSQSGPRSRPSILSRSTGSRKSNRSRNSGGNGSHHKKRKMPSRRTNQIITEDLSDFADNDTLLSDPSAIQLSLQNHASRRTHKNSLLSSTTIQSNSGSSSSSTTELSDDPSTAPRNRDESRSCTPSPSLSRTPMPNQQISNTALSEQRQNRRKSTLLLQTPHFVEADLSASPPSPPPPAIAVEHHSHFVVPASLKPPRHKALNPFATTRTPTKTPPPPRELSPTPSLPSLSNRASNTLKGARHSDDEPLVEYRSLIRHNDHRRKSRSDRRVPSNTLFSPSLTFTNDERKAAEQRMRDLAEISMSDDSHSITTATTAKGLHNL